MSATEDLLLVTPVLPDAGGDGREKRAFQWMRTLSATHRVHLLVLRGHGGRRGDLAAIPLPLAPASTEVVELPPRPLASLLRTALALPTCGRWPRSPLFWFRPRARDLARLRERYGGRRFARIVCFRLYLSEFALAAASVAASPPLLELDLDDLESDTWRSIAHRQRERGQQRRALRTGIVARQLRRMEDRFVPRFSRVYVCCRDDAASLASRFPSLAISVAPNRLPRVLPRPPVQRDARALLFVGALDYFPNEDAVDWLAGELLPLLLADDARWTLTVAGYGRAGALRERVASLPGLRWLGAVEDLAAEYGRAGIVVAPIRAGGGTKMKVVEAMLHGSALVATHEALRGLDAEDGEQLLVAESAADFAAACRRLAADAALARRLGDAARRFAEERFAL